ncbi:MAG: hypothetical protein ACYC6N_00990 [Pirellulaceae bacterium]
MKNLTVLISGAPDGHNLRDVEIEPGTSAGDVMRALDLREYLLSREGSAQAFAAEEPIYDQIQSGEKLRATPIAEVGSWILRFLRQSLGLSSVKVRNRGVRSVVLPNVPSERPPALVAPPRRISSRSALRVERDQRPLWQLRGWRRAGQQLIGAYRTPRGSFVGEIDTSRNGRPQFFITKPPQSLLNGAHAACFRPRGRGTYFVHMAVDSPEIDAGIVAIEKLIAKAI